MDRFPERPRWYRSIVVWRLVFLVPPAPVASAGASTLEDQQKTMLIAQRKISRISMYVLSTAVISKT